MQLMVERSWWIDIVKGKSCGVTSQTTHLPNKQALLKSIETQLFHSQPPSSFVRSLRFHTILTSIVEFLLNVIGCGFVDCSSSYGGVMIAEHDSNLTVDSSLFENNTASGNGGAINLWLGSKASITNVTIFGTLSKSWKSNFCVIFIGSSAPYGGAIYVEKNCTFLGNASLYEDNVAKFGAVLFVQVYSSAEISDSSFEGNIATRYGGAAYVIKSSNFSVSNSNFTGKLNIMCVLGVKWLSIVCLENSQTYEGVFRAALTSNATFTNCSFDGAPPTSSQGNSKLPTNKKTCDLDEEPENGFSHCPSSIWAAHVMARKRLFDEKAIFQAHLVCFVK